MSKTISCVAPGMNTFDSVWETIHQETQWGKYPSEEVIRFVMRTFAHRDTACRVRGTTRILDFGCGTGAVTWFLTREGFASVSLDGSRIALRKGGTRFVSEFASTGGLPHQGWVQADAGRLPFSAGAFDGIVDSAMIYANTRSGVQQILAECHRILKPGGKFFSTGLFEVGMTGYGTGEKCEEGTFREMTIGPLAHRGTAHFFYEAEIRELWAAAGFSSCRIDHVRRSDQGGKVVISYFMVEAEP